MGSPSWDRLFAHASVQSGHVTTQQAAEAGYSSPLLHKYVANGRLERVQRGIYRLVHYPASEDEQLVVAWLWSDRTGVFSHETALSRHGLSDLLPDRIEMTLPPAWKRRRLRVPRGLDLHYADLAESDRMWFGPVPITTPARSIRDCMTAGVSPEFIDQAISEGADRGLFTQADVQRWGRA